MNQQCVDAQYGFTVRRGLADIRPLHRRARSGHRTRDLHLGKVALPLSELYVREEEGGGIEPQARKGLHGFQDRSPTVRWHLP